MSTTGERLDAVLAELAAGLADVEEIAGHDGTTEYRRGSRPFAYVGPASAELRLPPDIADAARRTPATGPSNRGVDWLRFAPPALDQHAVDRARAWFHVAWRGAQRER